MLTHFGDDMTAGWGVIYDFLDCTSKNEAKCSLARHGLCEKREMTGKQQKGLEMREKEGALPRPWPRPQPHCGWQRHSGGESVVMDLPGSCRLLHRGLNIAKP
ncbi:hypothetical protein U0070_020329 [Myodes glareolus]|uniref:Uncharacterized protein n=1 Tax=Myodes glareolus TaxID=447135 RepID=A0AAW0HNP0_MYOGA